jgi:hypothetical protein
MLAMLGEPMAAGCAWDLAAVRWAGNWFVFTRTVDAHNSSGVRQAVIQP